MCFVTCSIFVTTGPRHSSEVSRPVSRRRVESLKAIQLLAAFYRRLTGMLIGNTTKTASETLSGLFGRRRGFWRECWYENLRHWKYRLNCRLNYLGHSRFFLIEEDRDPPVEDVFRCVNDLEVRHEGRINRRQVHL